jgi:hypothetical protein
MMLTYDDYSRDTCYLHCSDAMLPVNGERDAADGLRLLYATDWVPCGACTVGLNPDLACDPAAVSGAVPVSVNQPWL